MLEILSPTLDDIGVHESLFADFGALRPELRAAALLVLICKAGHGYDLGKDRRVAMKWWGEFLPERVAVSAMIAGDLSEFTSELCRRLKGQVGTRWSERGEAQRAAWRDILTTPLDFQRRVLDVLETQASVCVTLVRANDDVWKRDKTHEEDAHGEETNDGNRGGDHAGAGLFDGASAAAGTDLASGAGG